MKNGDTLVVGGIFRRGLKSVPPDGNGFAVHWLDAGLDAGAGRMKAALEHAITEHQDAGSDRERIICAGVL